MRIALIIPVLAEGGAGRVMVNMANYWVAADHVVTLFTFESEHQPPFYKVDDRVDFCYLRIEKHSVSFRDRLVNNWDRSKTIRRAVISARPDVVISFIDTGNVRVLLSLLGAGIPVVISERVHPAHEQIGWTWRVLRRLTYPTASSVVVQTSDAHKHIQGWMLRQLRVIPNAVNVPISTGEAPTLYDRNLLAVGRLRPQKSFSLLLRAFSLVADECPEWNLNIAGDGPLRESLDAQVVRLRLQGRVTLLGQQSDIAGLLSQSEVYVLSSAYEGFPNALCEAMASGLACISTECPSGPADIITNEVNGLLVASSDEKALAAALRKLMVDESLRARLGRNAREITETYSVERIMGMWNKLLTDVVGKARGGSSG